MEYGIDNLSHDLEDLENNLITVINDLKASTEIILKELTGYLNVSAHDLSEIRTSVIKVESALDTLKEYISKLDKLEDELNSIKPIISKLENNIINSFSDKFKNNNINLKKIASYIVSIQKQMSSKDIDNEKRLLEIENQLKLLSLSFKDTKDELITSQEGLFNIINTLTTNQTDIEKAQISLQGSKIKSETEQKRDKLFFIAKIIGIFFGSGGILFFVIKSIIESLI